MSFCTCEHIASAHSSERPYPCDIEDCDCLTLAVPIPDRPTPFETIARIGWALGQLGTGRTVGITVNGKDGLMYSVKKDDEYWITIEDAFYLLQAEDIR